MFIYYLHFRHPKGKKNLTTLSSSKEKRTKPSRVHSHGEFKCTRLIHRQKKRENNLFLSDSFLSENIFFLFDGIHFLEGFSIKLVLLS